MMAQSLGKRGLSIIEVIIAFGLTTFSLAFIVFLWNSNSNFIQRTSEVVRMDQLFETTLLRTIMSSLKNFGNIQPLSFIDDDIITTAEVSNLDDYTKVLHLTSFNSNHTQRDFSVTLFDYKNVFGTEYCTIDENFKWQNVKTYGDIHLGEGNIATDLRVNNNVLYLAADAASSTAADLFVIDITDPHSPFILSKINTGPGIAALAYAGNYIYAANTSINSELQIIDIHNLSSPRLVSSLKLPFGTVKGIGSSIFYAQGFIYLGTTKADGGEFSIIDVHDPTMPVYKSSFEINSKVNSIVVRDHLAYVGSSGEMQFVVLNVEDPYSIKKVATLNPPGYETQEGESLFMGNDALYFGRSVGGFNSTKNHELFSIEQGTSTRINWSKDIGASVNGIVVHSPYIFLGTNELHHQLDILDDSSHEMLKSIDMKVTITALRCSGKNVYASLSSESGLQILSDT